MIKKKEIEEEIQGISDEQLYDAIRRVLFAKKMKLFGNDRFQFKKILLNELVRRELLVIKLDTGQGPPYRTDTSILGGTQVNAILKACLYKKGFIECVVKEGIGGGVTLLEDSLTA